MKTMLKTSFFFLVNDLLAQNINPAVKWSDVNKHGILIWKDADGSTKSEPLYLTTAQNAYTMRARFDNWFAECMAKCQENRVVDAGIVVGCCVWDDLMYQQRTVTDIRAGGVLLLDDAVERSLSEVKILLPAEGEEYVEMTPTEAIKHMAHTLTDLIEKSYQPGFVATEAYADVKSNYSYVTKRCKDLATIVWLRNHLCFDYIGDNCSFADVNKSCMNQFNYILATGWRPASVTPRTLITMFHGVSDIQITKRYVDKIYGTAAVIDAEDLFELDFTWLMETGEGARRAGVPAIVSITDGKFTRPYEFSPSGPRGLSMNTLDAIQELDLALGFSADIFNEVFPTVSEASNEQ